MATRRTSELPLICLICGDVARGINFNVMTCLACKSFFRQHALKSQIKLQCQFDGDCKITRRTRNACSACRLKKCFELGMDPKLVGNRSQNPMKSKHIRRSKMIAESTNQLVEPLSLSLLRNDRSTLTFDEWALLSNILHAYDSISTISQVKRLFEQQLALPPKIRSKPSSAFDIIKYFYSSLQPFIERSPYFQNLPTDACRAIIQHNSATFGTINSIFIMREVNALDNPAFLNACHSIYGHEVMRSNDHFLIRLEPNGILVKLMLVILACSTNCSIVSPGCSDNFISTSSLISIINVQNIFVTMFWKYLIYQYGFTLAVRWFNSFIKYILDVLQSSYERPNLQHNDMVETIVEETTRLLTIND